MSAAKASSRAVTAVATCLALVAIAGCSGEPEVERRSALDHGRTLFSSTEASVSPLNAYSCSTCHAAEAQGAGDTRILPGHVLAGAVDRSTFWGGARNDLLTSINDCRYYFMNATVPWTADDEPAKALYAYLASLPKTAAGPLPFTVVEVAQDLPAGDRAQGASVFERSCRSCHGAVHTGEGRLRDGIPALPDESVQSLTRAYGFTKDEVRLTFVEKVRHGAFLGVYGNMPPYSLESLADADLSALLAYLELY